MERILNECLKEHDYATEFIEKVEWEYTSIGRPTPEQIERDLEKTTLKKQIAELKKNLSKTRNVRNVYRVEVNTQMAKRRTKYRDEIFRLSTQLKQIEMEEEGAEIHATTLTKQQ